MKMLGVLGGLVSGLALALVGCVAEPPVDESTDSVQMGAKLDCSYVKCAMPLCAQGQHLTYQGGCCPVCVGPEPKCEAVLCAQVACDEGEELVTAPGKCCGQCKKAAPVKECASDLDCPALQCFACPCPTTECRGNQCVTETPDPSTCSPA